MTRYILRGSGARGPPDGLPCAWTGWAALIKKVYEVDPLECKSCGGEMEIVSFIRDPVVIHKNLDHLDMLSSGNDPPRSPPDTEFTYEPIYDDMPYGDEITFPD